MTTTRKLHIIATATDAESCFVKVVDSIEPHVDVRLIELFINLNNAVKFRDANFPPTQVGCLLVQRGPRFIRRGHDVYDVTNVKAPNLSDIEHPMQHAAPDSPAEGDTTIMQRKIDELENSIAVASTDREQLADEVSSLRVLMNNKNEIIKKLQNDAAQQQAVIADLRVDVGKLLEMINIKNSLVETLQHERDVFIKERDTASADCASAIRELSRIGPAFLEAEENVKRLAVSNSELRKANERLTNRVGVLEDNRAEYVAAFDDMRNVIESVTAATAPVANEVTPPKVTAPAADWTPARTGWTPPAFPPPPTEPFSVS